MPLYLLSSNNTSVRGNNVWVADGTREICINYIYYPDTGQIQYAACVFRKSDAEYVLTEADIKNTEHTAHERFQIRPVQTIIGTDMGGDTMGILAAIRHEMCHGAGCKGPRIKSRRVSFGGDTIILDNDDSSGTSDGSFLSDSSDLRLGDFDDVPANTFVYRRCIQADEHNIGRELRYVFVAWKYVCNGWDEGRILYGASVYHRDTGRCGFILRPTDLNVHFDTALQRLRVCPVVTSCPDMPFGADCGSDDPGSKLMIQRRIQSFFDDKIFKRVGGRLQIRGGRLS